MVRDRSDCVDSRVLCRDSTTKWLTVPIAGRELSSRIDGLRIDEQRDWRRSHADLLRALYRGASFAGEMLGLVAGVYAAHPPRSPKEPPGLSPLVTDSMIALCEYFGIRPPGGFVRSADLGIEGQGWERVLRIVRHLGGSVYITGHGARRYMDHQAMEQAGVRVEYLDYQKSAYPQLHGPFTPYVSALDLAANLGRAGAVHIRSGTAPWREFLARA